MKLDIEHTTTYRFDAPLVSGMQQIRVTPRSFPFQTVNHWESQFENGTLEATYHDHFMNSTNLLRLEAGCAEVVIRSAGSVETTLNAGVIGKPKERAPLWMYRTASTRTEAKTGVRALIRGLDAPNELDLLHSLMARVRDEIEYEVGSSAASWTAEEALKAKKGVCQDHAHAFIAATRALGIPCRYASGYLAIEGKVEQTAMHAWAEAYVKDLGWVGFDAANGVAPDGRYVRVAIGLDYDDAAPVKGCRTGGAGETHHVQISIAQQ